MKSLLSLILLLSCCFLHTTKSYAMDSAAVHQNINELILTYNDSVYEAIFSIDDFKPFAVLNIDRIADEYDNQWFAPDSIILTLNQEEKNQLISSIATFIASKEKPRKFTTKIRNWCIADMQFKFISSSLGFNKSSIITAVQNITSTRSIIDQYRNQAAADSTATTTLTNNQIYFYTLNSLAAISFKSQLRYFAQVYNQLSIITKYND